MIRRLISFNTMLAALIGLLMFNDAGDGKTDPPPPPPADDTAKRIAAAEARAAAAAKAEADKAAAETLGMSVEDAKKLLDAKAEADKAAMTEAERMQTEAAEAMAAAQKAQAVAASQLHAAQVTTALAAAGITEAPEDLVPLVKVDEGATAEQITAAVAALAEARPGLFADSGGPAADHSTGGNGPASQRNNDNMTAREKAAAMRKAREGRSRFRVVQTGTDA